MDKTRAYDLKTDRFGEPIINFMRDYFGLDCIGLKDYFKVFSLSKNRYVDEPCLDVLGTPEFKEYCRRHVQEWRDERNLI